AVLDIVELLNGGAGATARWKSCLRGIDSLLDAIGLTAEARAKVVADGKEMLGREMRADTKLWSKIGDRFASERTELELLFDRDPVRDATHPYQAGFELLERRDRALAELGAKLRARDLAGELHPPLAGFAWSLVHMHANRMLRGAHRTQELVLYDFLRRLHAARRARAPK